MIYDRLSSAWPVNSGVLIHEGVAYFIAGLTDRDGTLAYALDAATGEPRWVNPNLGWIEEDRRAGLNCNGYLTVFDGRLRFNSGSKRQAALDLETGRPIPFPIQPRILIDGDKAVTTGSGHVNDRPMVRGGNRAFYGPDERLARGVRFSFKLSGDGAESILAVAPYQASAFLKENRADIWTGLFREVALYGQERDTAKTAVTKVDDREIRFTLTDDMLDDRYDFPLTIKIRMPKTWAQVRAVQGEQAVPASVITHNGDAYALVQAVPDRGEVMLRPNFQ